MKNTLTERFTDFISKEDLFPSGDSLLVAVSGGVDSVVLCELCKRSGFNFSIAHCNFNLRGKESDEDAVFVKQLASKYGVPYFEKAFDTEAYAAANKVSIQVAARELRYAWFNDLLNSSTSTSTSTSTSKPSKPLNLILTAHHADDNIETILMNFFKGSGINGLKGILPRQDKLVRPLLFAKKEELLSFANENKLLFREDSSNSSDKYTRNYFRNELIPGIEKVFPAVKENLSDNAERFREIYQLYMNSVEKTIKKLVTVDGAEIRIPVLLLEKTPARRTILYEIIKKYGFSAAQADEALKLLQSGSGKYIESDTHRILRDRKWLIISRRGSIENLHYLIEEDNKEIQFGAGTLKLTNYSMPVTIGTERVSAQIDLSDISFPLLLRKWKQGDYFYPLGMNKKKKLSRFFVDQKLSLNQKQDTWVIESNKRIIWIVGQRIDNRFRVTENTKRLLKINWLPSE